MPLIRTHELTPESRLSALDQLQTYVMRPIHLTRGYISWLDLEDWERLSTVNWQAVVSGYQVRAGRFLSRTRFIYLHHSVLNVLPWELSAKRLEVDHINRNPLDNRKENLRIVTHAENMANSKNHINQVGYCYNKRAKSWLVYLDVPGKKRKYLGYTRTKEEAHQRHADAKRKAQEDAMD